MTIATINASSRLQGIANCSFTYYFHAVCKADPELRSARARSDERLIRQIRRVWDGLAKLSVLVKCGANYSEKVYRQFVAQWNALIPKGTNAAHGIEWDYARQNGENGSPVKPGRFIF